MAPKSQFLSYKVQNGTNLTSNAGHLQIHLYLQNLTFSLSTIFTLIKVSSTSSSRTAKMTRLWTEEKINKINVLFLKTGTFSLQFGIFVYFFSFTALNLKVAGKINIIRLSQEYEK